MALRANASLKFVDYVIEDGGVRLRFVCADPGAGEPSDYTIYLTDVDVLAVTSQSLLAKLSRAYRASGTASRLDPFIGQAFTI